MPGRFHYTCAVPCGLKLHGFYTRPNTDTLDTHTHTHTHTHHSLAHTCTPSTAAVCLGCLPLAHQPLQPFGQSQLRALRAAVAPQKQVERNSQMKQGGFGDLHRQPLCDRGVLGELECIASSQVVGPQAGCDGGARGQTEVTSPTVVLDSPPSTIGTCRTKISWPSGSDKCCDSLRLRYMPISGGRRKPSETAAEVKGGRQAPEKCPASLGGRFARRAAWTRHENGQVTRTRTRHDTPLVSCDCLTQASPRPGATSGLPEHGM